jgi:hypothetical protein
MRLLLKYSEYDDKCSHIFFLSLFFFHSRPIWALYELFKLCFERKDSILELIFLKPILLKSNLLVSLWIFRPAFHEICCSSSLSVAFGYEKDMHIGETKAILNSFICRRIPKPVWHIEFSFHMLAFPLKWNVFGGGNAEMS